MLSYLIAASLSVLAYPAPAVEVGRACPADRFSCGNGQCIAKWRMCDGLPDCGKPGEPFWGADESQWLAGCATASGDARLAQAVRNSAERLELQLTAGPSGSYEDDDRERVRILGGPAYDDKDDRQVLGSGV